MLDTRKASRKGLLVNIDENDFEDADVVRCVRCCMEAIEAKQKVLATT